MRTSVVFLRFQGDSIAVDCFLYIAFRTHTSCMGVKKNPSTRVSEAGNLITLMASWAVGVEMDRHGKETYTTLFLPL